MDKSKKLKRYRRKDYTQVVDFPVEIVGRDGVVRRYSFEAAVRLYQRRIASAPSRYDDGDVVTAEESHCRARIRQLRESYLHRFGWSSLLAGPSERAGHLAGELTAFLRRCFGRDAAGSPDALELTWLQAHPAGEIWFTRTAPDAPGYLLYLYRFEHFGACEGREAFFDMLRLVQTARGADAETLVAFHHTADCGLVLTGTGEWAQELAHEAPELDDELGELVAGETPGLWARGVRLLSSGETEQALEHFEAAQQEQPYDRRAAVAVAVVGDLVGRPEVAETGARVGLAAFPEDPVLLYHLGLAELRQGRVEPAQGALERSLERRAGLYQASILLSLLAIRSGDHRRARADLIAARSATRGSELEALVARLLLALQIGRLALILGSAAVALSAVSAAVSMPGALVVCLVCCLLTLGAWGVSRRLLHTLTSDQTLARLRLPAPEGLGARPSDERLPS